MTKLKELTMEINGCPIIAYEGDTILAAAQRAEIDIPNLCQNNRLEAYGGCGVCVVEVAGMPKLMRACGTKVADGMKVNSESERALAARKLALQLLLSDHSGDCRPPCRQACPTNNDCQGYLGLIANGYYKEAIELVKEELPLPASIGRVCPHPCQDACRRGLLEGAVSIASLKQFVADMDLAGEKYLPEILAPTGKKIAIIGAGPAGLSAAYFLAKSGHSVEIFDMMPEAGGMLRYGIPAYRLPREVLGAEIDLIRKMGVKITTNSKLGVDITLPALRHDFDAVFLAVGAWKSSNLGCAGENVDGVWGGIDFLIKVASGEKPVIGKNVAIVGGGNTAIDACRTAVRLGADKVYLLYRRTREEMPAEDWEIQEAIEEGVDFHPLVAPLEVLANNGQVTALKLQKMVLGEPDKSGRRRPIPVDGGEDVLAVDSVIAAIGQKVVVDGLDGIALTDWKTILADEQTFSTNLEGVFAGGDGINDGPGIAITAIADGKNAAKVINSYLAGHIQPIVQPFLVKRDNVVKENLPPVPVAAPNTLKLVAPAQRKNNFKPITTGFTIEEAQKEAQRCLECGCSDYFECKLLPLLQKYNSDGKTFHGIKNTQEKDHSSQFIWRDPNKCVLCGMCVRVCREVVGPAALGWLGRGFDVMVAPAFGDPLASGNCVSCGQCVSLCPTGALEEHNPFMKTTPLATKATVTTCSYCDANCQVVMESRGALAVKNTLPQDKGVLCPYGKFGFIFEQGGARLYQPLKKGVEIDFAELKPELGQLLKKYHDQHSLAVSVSGRLVCEEMSILKAISGGNIYSAVVDSTPGNLGGLKAFAITKNLTNLIADIKSGAIKALLVAAEDYPAEILAEFKDLDVLVVADAHQTATVKMADYALPLRTIWETTGTYIDCRNKGLRVVQSVEVKTGMMQQYNNLMLFGALGLEMDLMSKLECAVDRVTMAEPGDVMLHNIKLKKPDNTQEYYDYSKNAIGQYLLNLKK